MSQNNKDLLQNRLKGIQKERDKVQQNTGKVIDGLVSKEEEKPDFKKMAEELSRRKEEETSGANQDHVKDTIYVQKDLYDAFNSLCVKHGDKKRYVNEALADYVQKKYKELMK